MPDTDWLDDNIELYAANVLTREEEGRVQHELDDLSTVERSIYDGRITEIQSVMADFAGRFAVEAPTDLRARVLDNAFSVAPGGAPAETPAPTASTAPTSPPTPTESTGQHAAVTDIDDTGADAGIDKTSGAVDVVPDNVVSLPDRASRSRRIGMALVAAAAVVAVALGAGVLIGRTTAPQTEAPTAEQQQRDQIADVLAAPDASLSVGRLDDNRGVISVVSSRGQDKAVAQLGDRRNPIPSDRQFQLWLVGQDGRPTSAGLVPTGNGGAPQLVSQIDGKSGLAVTVEPLGGSAQPTTAILAQIPLAT